MAQKGKIPVLKAGKEWRFRKEDIDRWLRRNSLKKSKNMMHNGHIGKSNEQVNKKDSKNFRLALIYLIIDDYEVVFIIHAQPSTFVLYGKQPAEILKRLGFQEYQGECNILRGKGCLQANL